MTKAKYTGLERRKYLRLPSRCVVKYIKLSKSLRPLTSLIIESYTKDICAAGIKFIVRKRIQLHTIIEFQFEIPGLTRSIEGLGEVVRIKSKDGGKSYNVGMKFIWIQQRNVELIDGYVRKKKLEEIVKKLEKK